MSSNEQVSPLMLELSKYIAGALRRKLPAQVTERAKIHLVDTFAAMISGSRLFPGKRVAAYVKPYAGTREAGVIGTRIVTSALYAALANGTCGHADETDDTHPPSRTHPGTVVIPAVLAIAERQRLSGELMLRALVLGYDVCTRVGLALKQEQLRKTGHNGTSKGGMFGAAAAAGALLKLDARRIRYVLSYCAQQAAGLITTLRETHHIEKASTHCGIPSHNGVMSALMVKCGFTGVEDVFSGDPNFLSIYSPQADREALVRGLGRDYEILRGGIKYWSAGGPIQAPLHVLHDLIRQHGFKADDVEKLVVRMPDEDFRTVDNRDMTDISAQHLLAVMLLDGAVTFRTAHDHARVEDPRVLKLRQNRIEVTGDGSPPDAVRCWRCAMEITLKDGRKLTHQTAAAKGTHQNPLTRREEEEKALDLMAPVLGKQRSRALIATLLNIESIKDARALRRLYAA